MKLLLTSNGFSNKAIADALFELTGKKPEDTKLIFIPTAANIEQGDKGWLINDLININKQNFKSVAIVDISAVPKNVWLPQFEEADVLFFEGGNTYHLMTWVNKSGLVKLLPDMLKTKVYVGLSAGSMITAPDLDLRLCSVIYGEEVRKDKMDGLDLVDFYFLPHLNSPHFDACNETTLKEVMANIKKKTYLLDDHSALKVTDNKVKHVGGGKYLEFN